MDAGNYEGCVLSDRGGHETPDLVRKSLSPTAEGAFTGVTRPLPGTCGSCPMAFITSWASVGSTTKPFDLTLGGQAKQVICFPKSIEGLDQNT